MKKLLILTIFLCLFSNLKADYLKVSRKASVKTHPDQTGNVVAKVESGTFLTLLSSEQENGYYQVQLDYPNQIGWVYRTFVRRYTGEKPDTETLVPNDPLSDPSYYYTDEKLSMAIKHLKIGKPQAIFERIYDGYVVAVDPRLKIPVWVQYLLTPADVDGDVKRKDDFHSDYSIPYGQRSELADYSDSNFDRGHMAPAADMKRSKKVMYESFTLSNMCPQVGLDFNRGIWADLEEAVRDWVRQKGEMTIITGPVFSSSEKEVRYDVIGDNKVAVPSHFYKIIVNSNNIDQVEVIAFVLPNKAIKGGDLKDYLQSVDEIERLTGYDFLSSLPLEIQKSRESVVAEHLW